LNEWVAEEGALGMLESGTETTESRRVRGDILLAFAFESLSEEVDKTIIKIFTSKVYQQRP
jgi:hypothetical protein